MVKSKVGFHHRNPKVVELKIGVHHGCPNSNQKCLKVVKLVIRLHHKSLEEVEFMMKLFYGSSKGSEANIEASPRGLSHRVSRRVASFIRAISEFQNEMGVIDYVW